VIRWKRGVLFAVGAVLAFAVAALIKPLYLAGAIVGMVCLFNASTAFSKASALAESMRGFLGKRIEVEVWGVPLPSAASVWILASLKVAGAGLLLHLRSIPDGPKTVLKVAQPKNARVGQRDVVIDGAAYVSWAGATVKRAERSPAVKLTLAAES
jgi:hypothetical protein